MHNSLYESWFYWALAEDPGIKLHEMQDFFKHLSLQ